MLPIAKYIHGLQNSTAHAREAQWLPVAQEHALQELEERLGRPFLVADTSLLVENTTSQRMLATVGFWLVSLGSRTGRLTAYLERMEHKFNLVQCEPYYMVTLASYCTPGNHQGVVPNLGERISASHGRSYYHQTSTNPSRSKTMIPS